MATSRLNPHRSGKTSFAPLALNASAVLRRFGDMNQGRIEADLALQIIDYANEVIEDLRLHPYWSTPLAYYTAFTDVRPVPDLILQHGIKFRYAVDQGDARAPTYRAQYYASMNHILYNRLNDDVAGQAKIEIQPIDGGSNGGRP